MRNGDIRRAIKEFRESGNEVGACLLSSPKITEEVERNMRMSEEHFGGYL